MKTIAMCILLILAVSGTALAADDASLFAELQAARLSEVALYVYDISNHGSSLLVGKPMGANPEFGVVTRDPAWGDMPVVTSYLASAPVLAKIEPIGDVLILGALRLLTEAAPVFPPGVAVDRKYNPAPPGVYLLAYEGKRPEWNGIIWLIRISVDGEGRPQFRPALWLDAQRSAGMFSSSAPPAGVGFPGTWVAFPPKVSSSAPPSHIAVVVFEVPEPPSKQRARYSFQLDVEKPVQ